MSDEQIKEFLAAFSAKAAVLSKKTAVMLGHAGKKTAIMLGRAGKKTAIMLGRAGKKTAVMIGRAGKKIGVAAGKKGGKGFIFLCKKVLLPLCKIMGPPLFVALLVFAILFFSGLGDIIGSEFAALTGAVPALLIIFFVCFIPAISPILGPGLLLAIATAILCGEQIAAGTVIPLIALPALFVIDAQIGSSFIPYGLTMGENEPATVNAGVPMIVFTRLITIPVSLALVSIFILGF